MKLANYNPKTHLLHYDNHKIVAYEDILKYGWYFKTFTGEEYVYISNGLVQRIFSTASKQIKNNPQPIPIVDILDNVKHVRNRSTELIYGRKYRNQQLRKIRILKKK